MPKTIESDILYSNITIQIPNVPASYDEVDKLLGETGAALDGWQADCLARNYLPRLYKVVAESITAKDPTKQKAIVGNKTETVKGKDGAPDTEKTIDLKETDIKFIKRVYEAADTDAKNAIAATFHSIVTTLPFYAEGDRSGSGKVAAAYVEAANGIVAAGNADQVATVIESKVPGYTVARDSEGKITVDGIARGIAALDKYMVQAAKRESQSLLTGAVAA